MPPPLPRRFNFWPYSPLIAGGVQIVWFVLMFALLLFVVGDQPTAHMPPAQERARNQFFDFIAMLPSLAGVLIGPYVIVVRRPVTTLQWGCTLLGILICSLFIFWLGHDLVTR